MGSRFFRYLRDPRVPRWRKLAGLFAVLYFVLPTDVLPDILPVLGWMDDVGVLSAAALFTLREVQRHAAGQEGAPLTEQVPLPHPLR